jgi:hypothetical protein
MKLFFVVLILSLLWACANPNAEGLMPASPVVPPDYKASVSEFPREVLDSAAVLLADSIVYDVVVKNPVPDDEWAEYCLRNVDELSIAHMIMEQVLAGKLQAYHYSTLEKMSVAEVKALDKQAATSRGKVAKMQFEEKWWFDAKTLRFVKRVYALMLAYEINDAEGRYKAGIKVYLPDNFDSSADSALVAK